jgi:3-phytase
MALKVGLLLLSMAGFAQSPGLMPAVRTESVLRNPDDPAIWRNPRNPAESLVLGTVKLPAPDGAIVVFGLDGKIRQTVPGVDRPNNIDLRGDLAVATERLQRRLRAWTVSATAPHLREAGSVAVFEGQEGEAGAPMGIGLYRRRKDGALFAIVSRKTGPATNYLWQYRLVVENGAVRGTKVREFGAYSGTGEIEAVAVDDERGLVYYADEDCCLRQYRADPDAPDAARELKKFGATGFRGNREGIAVAGGYVIATDQLPEGSEYHYYRRDTLEEVKVLKGPAESTDGIDALAAPLGPKFPRGLFVVMNNAQNNFLFFDWRDVERGLGR